MGNKGEKMRFRSSFRNKLKYILFLIVGISFCTNFIIYLSNIDKIKDETIFNMNSDNSRITSTISIIFNKMKGLYQLHYFDFKVKDIMLQNNSRLDEDTRFNNANYMDKSIKHVIGLDEYLIRATIITKYGDVYSNISYVSDDYLDFVKEEHERNFEYKDNRTIYLSKKEYTISQQKYNIITVMHQLFAYDTDKPLALLCVDIDYDAVLDSLKNSISQEQVGNILVLDGDNLLFEINDKDNPSDIGIGEDFLELLNNNADKLIQSRDESVNLRFKRDNYILTTIKNYDTNWMIIQYKSEKDILRDINSEIFKDIAWLVLIVLIMMLISYYFVKSVSAPLEQLNKVICQNYEGRLSKIDYDARNASVEIINVMQNYNGLVDRINDYVEKITNYEIYQRRAEMKILRYQINPHFLFNTLNTISAIAELSDQAEIVDVTENLSEIMKYALYGGNFVELKHELDAVNAYIEIQKIRFREKFEVSYNVDQSILSTKVIKFFIQPFIENTFKHGFSKISRRGIIKITAFMEDKYLIVLIRDNGIGMSPEKVNELNNSFRNKDLNQAFIDESWNKNIGMKNVNARLRHYYGNESEVLVSSSENEWTEICIKIPV